jgi:poly-gamma-glutamate capsule biosynthesis protein CapA/YwtB (metallophosphatase superfamily)
MGALRLFLIILILGASRFPVLSGEPGGSTSVTLLTFGDVNLGRYVGKKLLQGDTLYPFRNIQSLLHSADIVFCNLESQLSDQHGETQSPKNNLIFTGPPQGGASLARGGISIVSTANNHAYDYGYRALDETIANLDASGVWHVGTDTDSSRIYRPLVKRVSGVTFAFFAVTELMNSTCCEWKPYIAWADTGKLFPVIRAIRDSVDVCIVSYHGDEEYRDTPTAGQKRFFHLAIDAGVDIVVGHHSHVLQGIEAYKGGWCVFSLGNFVFYQPQRHWTTRSAGIRWTFTRKDNLVSIRSIDIIPIEAGFQPSEIQDAEERNKIFDRIHRLSTVRFPWAYSGNVHNN